mmetsp:Transcript_103222/g.313167  ORF Transcript_103222/g.313167 Transcript_103222/m.313167 type:complete len:213 (-) Transcript_103222:559-1197(-)
MLAGWAGTHVHRQLHLDMRRCLGGHLCHSLRTDITERRRKHAKSELAVPVLCMPDQCGCSLPPRQLLHVAALWGVCRCTKICSSICLLRPPAQGHWRRGLLIVLLLSRLTRRASRPSAIVAPAPGMPCFTSTLLLFGVRIHTAQMARLPGLTCTWTNRPSMRCCASSLRPSLPRPSSTSRRRAWAPSLPPSRRPCAGPAARRARGRGGTRWR